MYYSDAGHHFCTAGSYASHDLALKNAKFTMQLSTTCHTYHDFELKFNIQCTVFASERPIQLV